MPIQDELKNLGLKNNEIKVYLWILSHGLSTPPQIARGTNIARPNCYAILEQLKNKNLLSSQHQGKRLAFVAGDPEALVAGLEKQAEAAKNLLPDLRALNASQKNKPIIQFFDGWEQVKQIYEQSFSAKEIYALGSTSRIAKIDQPFLEYYEKKLRKKEIFLHDISPVSSRDTADKQTRQIMQAFYDTKFLPEKYADIPTDLLLWENNLALITLYEPIFGTIITSKALAETFKIVLQILRNNL